MASARSGARSASTLVVLSIFSRMSAIAFWFLSLSISVRRSVSRWMRSISSGALLSSAPSPPELDGMTGQPCGPGWLIGRPPLTAPVSWISLTPVKPTPLISAVVPCSTGVSSSTLIRTQTNSGRSGSSEIFSIWPTGHAREADRRALVQPAHGLREINIEAARRLFDRPASHTANSNSPASIARTTAPTRT